MAVASIEELRVILREIAEARILDYYCSGMCPSWNPHKRDCDLVCNVKGLKQRVAALASKEAF